MASSGSKKSQECGFFHQPVEQMVKGRRVMICGKCGEEVKETPREERPRFHNGGGRALATDRMNHVGGGTCIPWR